MKINADDLSRDFTPDGLVATGLYLVAQISSYRDDFAVALTREQDENAAKALTTAHKQVTGIYVAASAIVEALQDRLKDGAA